MNRNQLYALGEPFGECCTRKEGCRVIYGGGSSSSKSSSSSSTTTVNTDRRQVVDGGSVGVSSDSSTVNVEMTDQGAVKSAIDLVRDSGAAAYLAYSDLLNATVTLGTQANKAIQSSTDLAGAVTQAQTGATEAEKEEEQKKQFMIYGGIAIATYLAVRKGKG